MSKEIVARILKQYGYSATHIADQQIGYRNQSYVCLLRDGRRVNIILYKREPHIVSRIKNAHYVASWLYEQGFATRVPLDPRLVALTGNGYRQYAAIYNYLPGETIAWEAYTMEHIKQLGSYLSNIHAALGQLPQGPLEPAVDDLASLLGRMETYFASQHVKRALLTKLQLTAPSPLPSFHDCFALLARAGKQQAVHLDFVRGNILFSAVHKGEITGVIDFEKAAWGHPVLDIARTLAFLVVDCKYKTENKVRKYFVASGYNKRGASTFTDEALLGRLVDFYLLHDFYKFLRHNPYESLPDNEHFIRTRNFLLQRELIHAAA